MFFVLLFTSIAVATASHCSATERSVWYNNQPFADSYRDCSRAALGLGPATVTCMNNLRFGLSEPCLNCFGQATECGAENCAMQCALDETTPLCLQCIADNCLGNMRSCVGATSDAELPLTPTRRGASSTTPAPIRTRRRPTTTAEPETTPAETSTTTEAGQTTSAETSSTTEAGETTSTETTSTTESGETTSTETSSSTQVPSTSTSAEASTETETMAPTTEATAQTFAPRGAAGDVPTTTTKGVGAQLSVFAALFAVVITIM